MQDVVWFAGITAAVVSVVNILAKGNRLAIAVALYFVFSAMRELSTAEHLYLRWLGGGGQMVLVGLAIAELANTVQEANQHQQQKEKGIVHRR